ncbi:hypothetical protein HNY73_010794 [Argiope bruennichi]|uniref:Uncharacterized protein n=1 Tax=Argiope bruennichi TaxID=94029 RepID=A0A8T0F438_ARGBR|nr:hypothetical protein HNY73_010794 [Argiope bruennichi]
MARGQSVMLGSSFKPKIEEQTKRLETFNKSIKTEDLGKEVPVVRVFPMKEFTASEEETEESNIESFHHYISHLNTEQMASEEFMTTDWTEDDMNYIET